jgi:sugar phosphate isomerase/epimerase
MNKAETRRSFLGRPAALAGASVAAHMGSHAAKRQQKVGDIKPVLYSITYLGYWYRGDALSMEQLIHRAQEYGYAGIEIEGKRPHGCPLDWPKNRSTEFRKRVADAGLVISNVAADNDFTSPISEHRECQLSNLRDHIRMAADLNARCVRIFLAWAGATPLPEGGGRYDLAQKTWDFTRQNVSREQLWEWSRQGLIEMSRFAGDHGVVLALQNHKPMITNYRQVLQMIKEVGSPHLKACIDAPLMEKTDAEYLGNAVKETGPLQVHSHFGGDFDREVPGKPIRIKACHGQWGGPYIYNGYATTDIYTPFVQAMLETGYQGYIGYELCHPLPMVNGKTVGIDYVDNSARLGAEYIKSVIVEAKKRAMAA